MTPQRRRRDTGLLVLMCSTQFLNVANISSVNIALPEISTDLGFSAATLPWVVSAYLLTFASFLLVSARIADLHWQRAGRRRLGQCRHARRREGHAGDRCGGSHPRH